MTGLQGEGPPKPEVSALRVEFNKPFQINPPKGFARFALEIHYPERDQTLFTQSLIGEGDSEGSVTIDGFVMPDKLHSGESVLLPAGSPHYELSLDPTTGLTIVNSLPITPHIQFGPVSEEQIDSGEISVSLFSFGKEYQAQPWSLPFGHTADPRSITTQNRWLDVDSGKTGPLYLPSGTDFRKIDFVINNNPR